MWPWQSSFASKFEVPGAATIHDVDAVSEEEEKEPEVSAARKKEAYMERLSMGAWEPSTEEKSRALGSELRDLVGQGDADAVRDLVDRGALMDTVDESTGRTPIINAASLGHAEVVNCLAENGADLCHRDHQGESPLNPYRSVRLIFALVFNHVRIHDHHTATANPLTLTSQPLPQPPPL